MNECILTESHLSHILTLLTRPIAYKKMKIRARAECIFVFLNEEDIVFCHDGVFRKRLSLDQDQVHRVVDRGRMGGGGAGGGEQVFM